MGKDFLQRLLILLVFVYGSFGETLAQGAGITHGTAVAVYRSDNEIIVAADSKATHEDDSPYVEPVCKIRQFGSTFVAAAGIYEVSGTGFDLWEIVSVSVFGAGGLSDIVKTFDSSVRFPLQNAVTAIKNQYPKFYQKRGIKTPWLSVFFLGIEDNVLTLKGRKYSVYPETDDLLSVKIETYDCPGKCRKGKGAVLVQKGEVKNRKIRRMFIDPLFSRGAKFDTVDLARKFVQMMIDKNTINYGPPIDILSITKDGAKWIQKKETCPEIKK